MRTCEHPTAYTERIHRAHTQSAYTERIHRAHTQSAYTERIHGAAYRCRPASLGWTTSGRGRLGCRGPSSRGRPPGVEVQGTDRLGVGSPVVKGRPPGVEVRDRPGVSGSVVKGLAAWGRGSGRAAGVGVQGQMTTSGRGRLGWRFGSGRGCGGPWSKGWPTGQRPPGVEDRTAAGVGSPVVKGLAAWGRGPGRDRPGLAGMEIQ